MPDGERARTVAVPCEHCGLDVPAALVEAGSSPQFCCEGCRTVYAALRTHGLGGYYDLARRSGATIGRARTTGRRYEHYADPAFVERFVRGRPDGLATVELYLEGVHCAACVWLVERIPVVLPGAAEARLDLGRSMATVTWDPRQVSLSEIARFLDGVGYPSHPFRGVEVREMRRREDRALLIRMAVAGACAGNVMLLAFALYGGKLHGIEPHFESLFRWVSLGVSLPALVYSAGVFFKGAFGALRTRTPHMDVPISIGILAGFLWGTANTVRGRGDIYFDTLTALIFLLLVGRWIQQRHRRAFADASELLYSLTPSVARKLEGTSVREVPVDTLIAGCHVEVLAGESIPVDGTVVAGDSWVDTSILTGESSPAEVGPGVTVLAGSLNLASRLEVLVESSGHETRVAGLMRLVAEESKRRAPIVVLADRISGIFVAGVLALAALTVAIWIVIDPSRAVENAVALLIVTCPCALGMATPLAVGAAIGRASRAGILIKGGDVLERLARPGLVLLDKTGTLTEGRIALVRWRGEDDLKPLVLALESQVSHPVARAFALALGSLPALPVREVRATHGGGVEGIVADRRVVVGSPAFVAGCTRRLTAWAEAEVDAAVEDGLTPVVVAADGEVKAVAGLGDALRSEARSTLDRLRDRGFAIGILSGDHPRIVSAVARTLGIPDNEARGGMLPEDKYDAVRRASGNRPVTMIGDGVNDAAALAAATVGVAVHGGAEAALRAADVFLTRPGLASIADLLEGSARTLSVIRLNLLFSLVYNVIGAALAMAGRLDPLVAAILMPASSIAVVTLSYRSRTFEEGSAFPCP